MHKKKAAALIRGIISVFAPNKHKGFTILELIICIVIVFILYAMSTPNICPARGSARKKACYSNMRVIESAYEMYMMDHSSLPPAIAIPQLLKEKYLISEPTCPESGSYSLFPNKHLKGSIIADCSKHGTIEPSTAVTAADAAAAAAAAAEARAIINKRNEEIRLFTNKLHQSRIVTLILIAFVYIFYFLLTIFFTADIKPPKTKLTV